MYIKIPKLHKYNYNNFQLINETCTSKLHK